MRAAFRHVAQSLQTGGAPLSPALELADLEANRPHNAGFAAIDVRAVVEDPVLFDRLAALPAKVGTGRRKPRPLAETVHKPPRKLQRASFWRWQSAFLLAVPATVAALTTRRLRQNFAPAQAEQQRQQACRAQWCRAYEHFPFVTYPTHTDPHTQNFTLFFAQGEYLTMNYTGSCLEKFGTAAVDIPFQNAPGLVTLPPFSGPYGIKMAFHAKGSQDTVNACPAKAIQTKGQADLQVVFWSLSALMLALAARYVADVAQAVVGKKNLQAQQGYPLAAVTYPELYELRQTLGPTLARPGQQQRWQQQLFTELACIAARAAARGDADVTRRLQQVGLPVEAFDPTSAAWKDARAEACLLGEGPPANATGRAMWSDLRQAALAAEQTALTQVAHTQVLSDLAEGPLAWLPAPQQGALFRTAEQFSVQVPPERAEQLAALRASFGSSFAFYGSERSHWHPIICQGFEVKNAPPMQRTRSPWGPGVYLAKTTSLAADPALVGSLNGPRVLGLVEVIDHPSVGEANGNLVVPHDVLVQLRGLLAYPAGELIPEVGAAEIEVHAVKNAWR